MKIITGPALIFQHINYFLPGKKQTLFASALIALFLFTGAAAHSNNTVDQPALHSPAKNVTAYPELSPTFQWTAGSSSASLVFDLYLGTNANQLQLLAEHAIDGSFNDSCIIYLSQDTFNLFYFGQLNRNTTYYWKVVAKDNTGASAASETWAFTTGSPNLHPPDAPVYVSPGNNTLNILTTPLFKWQEGTDPDGDKPVYDLYLSENASATSLIAASLSTPSFQMNTPLKGNTNYFWKIVVRDAGGKEATGAVWRFTTQNNAPAPAVLSTPVHQATGTDYNITLTWQKALDAEGDSVYYEVWYGAGAMPDRMQVTGNNNLLLNLAANTVYNWKIVSVDIHGGRSESEIRTFTTRNNTANTPPTVPVLIMPANNGTGISFQPALQWNTANDNDQDAISYTVYMGTDAVNLTAVVSGLANNSYTPVLEAGKKYFWKVVALDNRGGVSESDTWQFTTTTQDVGITNLRVYYRYTDPTSIYNFESSALKPVFNINTRSYTVRGRTTVKDAIAIVLDYTDPNTVVTVDLPPSFTSTTNIIYNKGLPSNATKYIQVEGNFTTHNVIKVRLQHGAITREYSIDAQINQKPTLPVLQQPANGAANAAVQPAFGWTGGDDTDGNTVIYRLFIGSSATTLSAGGSSLNQKSITPFNPLAGAQKYYWKITATDADNETVESAVHSFVTQAIPLSAPRLQYPREISTYVEPNVTLSWKYRDAPGITYDIYLDRNPSPQRIAQGITGNTFQVQNLAPNTTYYWKVSATDRQGVVTTSKTNQFITKPVNGNVTGTFTDTRDGEIYQWVQINGLRWMTHNLAYRPQVKDGYFDYDYFNTSGTTKSYTALNNSSLNISKYGYLYNWEAALNFDSETDTGVNKQGVCPCGWRVATPADWQKLAPLNTDIPSYVHHSTWTVPGKENEWLNTSGLSMLPSGLYSTQTWPAGFQTNAFQFWLANNRLTNNEAGYAWYSTHNRFLSISNGSAGFASVRCVKNDNENHAPNKPVLQTPLNNSTQTNYNMLLQWAAATDADGNAITYNLYVDTIPDPARCIQTGITGTGFHVTELEQNKTYYWKVRARDSHGEMAESEVWVFTMQAGNNTAPTAVQLLSPAHGSTGVNVSSVNVTWTAATDTDGDAIAYNLYAGKQPTALHQIAAGITATGYHLTNLLSSTQYFWKVVAIDGRGGVTESAIHNFSTLNHAPTAPVLIAPVNGLTGAPKELVLSWNRSTDPDGDAVYYSIAFGTDPAALNPIPGLQDTTYNFGGSAFLANTTYYWKVIATDQKGGETASELRQYTTFRNEFPSLGLTPVNPANNNTGVSLTPSLSWTKPARNMLFDVYAGTSYTFYSLVAGNITDTPFVLNHINGAALKPHTTYLWKVVPKDAAGNTHAADVWQFTTRNSVPAKPQLSAPTNNAAAQPYSVSLNWLPVNDADGDLVLYDVYLGSNTNPTALIASGLQQTNYTTALLTPNATYYWKVVAKDAFGGTIASDEFSFTVQNNSQNTAPAAPQLTSPLTYESGISNTAVLQWNAAFDIDGDALVYDVYVSTSQAWGAPVATGVGSLQYTTAALTHGVTWYWKVVARDNKGGETASEVWNFTVKNNAPSAPIPLTPLLNAVLTGTNTSLTWAAATDPENDAIVYDVYLDKNPQPVTLLAKGLTTLNYNTPAIDNNGVYYWQVIARDALGAATPGPVYTFTGKNEAPSAPALQLPANNNNITTNTATLTWQASTDIDSDAPAYDMYMGSSAATLQKAGTVFTTSFTSATLTVGTTYYWKVVARDKQQATTESAVWSFTVQSITPNQPPAAPQLVSPANQSVNIPVQQIQFTWTAAIDPEADPVQYDLYLSTNAQAETRIAADINSVSYTLNNLVANTTYYWKVVAKDDHGNSTAGNINQFTTGSVTGTIDPELDRAIKISPNPTSGHIVITLPELLHSWNIELYTGNGHKLYSRTVNGYVRKQELVIPVKGIFFIRLTNNRKTAVRKIIVL
ncbi:fibronectin type III domain-containing protein [Niastella populi]|uniref:Fibronectin type-III domain-containing protein n=1 Tax=Niastella populi TaxID=550983 RepID=A0A1V9GCK3_9BACT|nr:FISUMP domain-containing protein [Niastella populi]OQP68399.1 hypothetical protein A4R26_00905 [Niastella populi]